MTEDELRGGCDTVVCDQCSLSVRVLFTMDEGGEADAGEEGAGV